MAHTHADDQGTYYMDQLCTIALCGAMALACITLYTWQPQILMLILHPAFHPYVFWGGVALLVLVVMRAVSLWQGAGVPVHADPATPCGHDHAHEHGHEHAHDHGHACDHDHSHEHELGQPHHHHDHQHAHQHAPSHVHENAIMAGMPAAGHAVAEPVAPGLESHASVAPVAHDHAHDHGHDHGWAPWRYVVLLLPIMLYLLRLPNEGFRAEAGGPAIKVDLAKEAAKSCWILASASPLQAVGLARALVGGKVEDLDFKTLESASVSEDERKYWQGRTARVIGQFAPQDNNDKMFSLVRFKIQCCAADVIPLRVVIVCGESVAGIQNSQWVEVTGQIDFWQAPGQNRFVTVLKVPNKQAIKPTKPDFNPYVQ